MQSRHAVIENDAMLAESFRALAVGRLPLFKRTSTKRGICKPKTPGPNAVKPVPTPKTRNNAKSVEKQSEVLPKEVVEPCPEYDCDAERGSDGMALPEHAPQHFDHLRKRQVQFKISPYLSRMITLSPSMRATAIDWMSLTHYNIQYENETLYLGVKIFDMFLDKTHSEIVQSDLQFVAGVCLGIAAKYEEREPRINDILYNFDVNYTTQQFFSLEIMILKDIGFAFGVPVSYGFLCRFDRVIKTDAETLALAKYILETSLMFYEFVTIKDDVLAAGALLLALQLKGQDWDARLVKYTKYTSDKLEPIMWSLNHIITRREYIYGHCENIYRKYCSSAFHFVAYTFPLKDRGNVLIPAWAINDGTTV